MLATLDTSKWFEIRSRHDVVTNFSFLYSLFYGPTHHAFQSDLTVPEFSVASIRGLFKQRFMRHTRGLRHHMYICICEDLVVFINY